MHLIIIDPSQCPAGCDCYACEKERFEYFLAQLEEERVRYPPRFKGFNPPYGRRRFNWCRDMVFALTPNRYNRKG